MSKPNDFFDDSETYLVETFRDLTMKPLEDLRKKKLIGSKLDAALNIYCGKGDLKVKIWTKDLLDYAFFSLWNTGRNFRWTFLREILQVSEVNVILDLTRVYDTSVGNFQIEAVSLSNNPEYSKCPRCRYWHKRKNCWSDTDKDNNIGYICLECEELMKIDYPEDKVTESVKEFHVS